MATPGDKPPDADFSDSDQQWFDRLSGRPVDAGADPQALREADALRRALDLGQQRADADPRIAAALAPPARARRRQQLQFRLRQEGLLQTRPPWQRRWLPAGAAIAASITLATLLVPRLMDGDGRLYDEPPTMRGEVEAVRRSDAQPKQAAEALAATLRAGGLQPRIYQRQKTFTVDVDLAPDAPDAALAAMRQAGLVVRPGLTRVVVEPR